MTLQQFKARAREEFAHYEEVDWQAMEGDELVDVDPLKWLDTQFDKLMEEVKGMVPEVAYPTAHEADVKNTNFDRKTAHNSCRTEFLRRLSAFMSK